MLPLDLPISDKQKIKDEKNIVRMIKEFDRTEQLVEVTMDELGQISIINSAVRDQLRNEEDNCLMAEEQLKVRILQAMMQSKVI